MRNKFTCWVKWSCTLILLYTYSHTAISQALSRPQFESYTIEEGLPSNQVYETIQDQQGLIWFATSNGLCQFDGQEFRVVSDSAHDTHIKCALVDRSGLIWLGTQQNGLQRFDPNRKTFTTYVHDEKDSTSISNDQVLSLLEDQYGTIWVGTENGLNRFDPKTEVFHSYLPQPESPKALAAKAVLSLMEDSKGRIWVGTWEGGLHLLDRNYPFSENKPVIFRRFYQDSEKPYSLSGNKVWSLFEDSQGRIWVGTFNDGLNLLDGSTLDRDGENQAEFFTFQHIRNSPFRTLSDNKVTAIGEGTDGEIWAGTIHGLNLVRVDSSDLEGDIDFTKKSPAFFGVFGTESSPFHISHDNVEHIFRDKDDIVWISTAGGISKYDPAQYPFESHLQGTRFRNNNIRSFTEIDKNFWIGAEGTGLISYDLKQKKGTYLAKKLAARIGSNINYIRHLWQEGKTIWITHQGGISALDTETEEINSYEINLKDELDRNVAFIASDLEVVRPDLFLIATDNGLVRFNPENGAYRQYLPSNDKFSIATKDINTIQKGPNGNYWLGSYGSLMKLHILADDQFIFKAFEYDRNDPNSLGNTRVISLEATEDYLWVGTEDGLFKYNFAADRFEKVEHERLNALIVSLIYASDGQLWGSTRNGLFSINLEHQKINNFDIGLGLERENFVMNSNFESQNGILFFGTNDGFISFKPEDISYNEVPPTIIFTEFTVFGEPMTFEKDLNFLDEIKLYDDQNYFSISFAALNYHQPDMNQYAFKMEGFDPDWRILKDGNSVSYSNLSEGSYTFRVRASNNNQVWNTEGAALKLVIIPPFWKMRWFRIVLFCLVGLLGVLFYRNRVKWVEKRRKILEKVVKERTQEIQVQKVQIEELNKELQKRNENLEIIVSERTKDLREANEELRRSNNELEHFAYAASHDMKEPIRMVSNFVQLLDKHYGEQLGENGKRYVKFAVDGVSRMSGLIQNLLEYATLGKAEMKFEKANLNEVVKDKLQDLQHFIKDRNGQMIIESLPEEIICEPEQVGMLFYNLIGNGFKFNKSDQPVVKVGLFEENEEVYQFFIEDNGIGIREEDTDKIFAIFKRLNHRTEFDGTGIGLAICKRIVQKHEGTISLTSEVGKGTTFYFTISKNLETKYSK